VLGAVYTPAVVIEPPVPDQVTEVFVEPVTVAVNCCCAPADNDTEVGLIEIDTDTGAVTVIVAFAVFVLSATLVAVKV